MATVMAAQSIVGGRAHEMLGLSGGPTPVTKTIKKNPLEATRCKLDVPFNALTKPVPREDCYMVVVQIAGKASRELWLDDKPIRTEPLYAGGVVFHDLRQSPLIYMNDPIDSVHYYLSRKLLDAIADDADAPRISDLKFTPGVGLMDHVVAQLTHLLLPAFEKSNEISRLFADHISLALGAHVAQIYGGMRAAVVRRRGSLAAWQERRAKELLSANLQGEISTADVAKECSLSVGHFARAFRQTTGLSPHQWLLRRRVDEANGLLRDSKVSLAEIARMCGFADQSHFTRVYTRLCGISPGAWRRQQEMAAKN